MTTRTIDLWRHLAPGITGILAPSIEGTLMKYSKLIAVRGCLLGLIVFASACVVAPREGYWDHDHHRYYHENAWHDCGDRDEHCR
jgi:hypothetical protein